VSLFSQASPVFPSPSPRRSRRAVPLAALLCLALGTSLSPLAAQTQSSSSSSSSSSSVPQSSSSGNSTLAAPDNTPNVSPLSRSASITAGGSATTLETSEPLFDLAVALNACGYDDDLAHSDPVRQAIRSDVQTAVAASPEAQAAHTALCAYIDRHQLNDPGLNLAQYISLSLYLSPPPQLTPTLDQTQMPPDSTQVVNILPLLRTFAESIQLHTLWVKYRPQYEELVARVHDPLTQIIIGTNRYLNLPVSGYDGRRFLVLLEPLLAPSATNARIYGSDYIVVTSPAAQPKGSIRFDQVRHTYLHYVIEPLIYSRASAMNRLQPLLKTVQDAPLDFNYKSDIVALITECMIKAVEAHTMAVDLPLPVKPDPQAQHDRVAEERYTAEMIIYERQSEATRRNAVDLDMRHGWVLTQYFYDALATMQRDGTGLNDDIGPIVYGMDISREQHRDQQIAFLPDTTQEVVHHAPRQLIGLDLAESKLMTGDMDAATAIANKVLAETGPGHDEDHARAHYLLARADLLDQNPEQAVIEFHAALDVSRDPRTLAWCHIYLGRLYDMQQVPDRRKALAEYHLALNLRDDRPDTKAAAESGIKAPFALPKRDHTSSDQQDDDNTPFDPTGKAEKEAYRPPPPPQ
jgi:tetratricopeptide (TPR) repeat protein